MKRRQAVEHARDTLGRDEVTERRACRMLGQARNSQRRTASVADDEPRFVWMAITSASIPDHTIDHGPSPRPFCCKR